jgi:hypothetical protein
MVNTSTNINKTNNHFSPLLTERKKEINTNTYAVRNSSPDLGLTQKYGGVQPVKGILILSSCFIVFNFEYLIITRF